jgi:hypothetical protein
MDSKELQAMLTKIPPGLERITNGKLLSHCEINGFSSLATGSRIDIERPWLPRLYANV